MKFVANLLVAIHNVAAAEAMVLANAAGLDPDLVVRLAGAGAGASRMFDMRAPMMAARTYTPATMRVSTWQKDMDIIGAFARDLGVDATAVRGQCANLHYRAGSRVGRPGHGGGVRGVGQDTSRKSDGIKQESSFHAGWRAHLSRFAIFAVRRREKIGVPENRGNKPMTISRRQMLHGTAGLATAAALPTSARAQSAGPIRVGLLTVRTGPLASGGIDMELCLDDVPEGA